MPDERQDTPLGQELKARIARAGPIPVEAYMRACLQDPEHGYYRAGAVIGAAGDFTTAPEISQVFGELIGIWAAVAWRAMAAPQTLHLVELGPGRGTLMRDIMRAVRVVPGFVGAARVHLVESNSTLCGHQAETLKDIAAPIEWHSELGSVPIGASSGEACGTIVIANEFLDALPVRQLIFASGSWHERCVGLDQQGGFEFVQGQPASPDLVPAQLPPPRAGDIFEIRPDLHELTQTLSTWAAAGPMAALFIDYGHAQTSRGDTLQAVSKQRYVPPLEQPGTADLSAHVDFEALCGLSRRAGLVVDGPITQSEFLLGLGLAERAARLMAHARPDQAGLLEAGARRITDPMGMGGRFKVACIRAAAVPVLPPFAPSEQARARRL